MMVYFENTDSYHIFMNCKLIHLGTGISYLDAIEFLMLLEDYQENL